MSANVFIDSFRATGQTVNFPQYEVNITINWTGKDNQARTHTELVRFPNILNHANIDNAWRREQLENLILAAVRKIAGVDD